MAVFLLVLSSKVVVRRGIIDVAQEIIEQEKVDRDESRTIMQAMENKLRLTIISSNDTLNDDYDWSFPYIG